MNSWVSDLIYNCLSVSLFEEYRIKKQGKEWLKRPEHFFISDKKERIERSILR
jgi:hypothetical protein